MNESVFIEIRKNMAELLYNMIMGNASKEELKSFVDHTVDMIDTYKALKYYSEKYPMNAQPVSEDTEKNTED